LSAEEQIEIYIPSIHAMFDLQIWRHPVNDN
jgi:hypothetical protein